MSNVSTKKKSILGLIVIALVMAGASARGAILVYEPFDYAVSNQLSGASGSTEVGLTGTWLHDWVKVGYVFPASSGWADSPTWDGVVDNVPTAPLMVKYAGSKPLEGEARMRRVLSSDAGTLAGADNILWLSAVYHMPTRGTGIGPWIGLGSGYVIDRGLTIKAGPSGGKDFMGSSMPVSWNNTLHASIETNAVAAVWDIFPVASLPPVAEDWVVVLKYTFGDGTTSTVDTVEGVVFSETDTLSEAAFNSHPDKAVASIDSSLIDESTFNVLSFTHNGTLNAIDEIRIGDTFDDVVGLAAGPVDAGISSVLASPGAVSADGSMPSVITVALRDAFWLPVTNHTVSLSGSTGNATITAVNATSDASGDATFEVTSSTVGTEVFTATDTTASVVITQTASVEFLDVDTTAPPTPTFVTPLGPATYHSITVVANPVTDPEGKDVEYRFNNVTLATDSGWLSSPSNTFVGLDPETSYSFTVEARDTAFIPNVSAASGAQSATTLARPQSSGWSIPHSTANVLVWLDASDTGTLTTNASGQVSQWADKSGHDNHQLQANASFQPVSGTRTILGLNTVDFDGADDFMQETTNAFGSVISNTCVFMVVEMDRAMGTREDFIDLNPVGNDWVFVSYLWDTPDAMFRYYCNGVELSLRNYTATVPGATDLQGATSLFGLYDSPTDNVKQIWVNGVKGAEATTSGATTVGSQGIRLAMAGANDEFDGPVAEVVIIDGTITPEERQEVEGYLAWKWGSELSLPADHPYRDMPPAGPPPAGTVIMIE